ncbi:NAD(P)H-hydrate epimerase, partial [Solemya elarraichensis gill symbiont]
MTEMRRLPQKDQLPYALYRAAQVRELDRLAIEQFSIPSLQLMERAGSFAFELLCKRWPDRKTVTVLCGGGNNGGDGYVVARLAHEAGFTVRLLPMVDETRLQGDALINARACEKLDIDIIASLDVDRDHGVIVDALLGTGLDRQVEGRWAECIAQLNSMRAPVLAIDIPSGLNADSGVAMDCAVHADATATCIGLKQGLFSGDGPGCCGEIWFDSLNVPAKLYASQILSARRLDWNREKTLLRALMPTAHKGNQGH